MSLLQRGGWQDKQIKPRVPSLREDKTKGVKSQPLEQTNQIANKMNLFSELVTDQCDTNRKRGEKAW